MRKLLWTKYNYLWRNFRGNVFANSNWSFLLISASEIHCLRDALYGGTIQIDYLYLFIYWAVQLTAARWSGRFKMLGALWTLYVSVNNASMRTVWKWLIRNNGHSRFECHVSRVTHEAIVKPAPKAQNSFWIKGCIGQDMVQVQLTKLSRVLEIVWQKYMEVDGRHSEHFFLFRILFTLTVFALSWIVETIFDNVSTAKFPWLKAT